VRDITPVEDVAATLGDESSQLLNRVYSFLFGTLPPDKSVGVVEAQRRTLGVLTSNKYTLKTVVRDISGMSYKEFGGWNVEAEPAPGTVPRPGIHWLDSYNTHVCCKLAVAHAFVEFALCCKDLLKTIVARGAIPDGDKQLLDQICTIMGERGDACLSALPAVGAARTPLLVRVDSKDLLLMNTFGFFHGVMQNIMLGYALVSPEILPNYEEYRRAASNSLPAGSSENNISARVRTLLTQDRAQLGRAVTNFVVLKTGTVTDKASLPKCVAVDLIRLDFFGNALNMNMVNAA
jgi:hypothetical protein